MSSYLEDSSSDLAKDLIEAAKDCDGEKVYNLLKQGVSPNVIDHNGKTPLHYAVGNADCQCCTCAENSENCLLVLLQSPQIDINIQDKEGLTALNIAAENQFEKCVKTLIHKGGDIYKYSNDGEQGIRTIVTRTPDVMAHILDNSVTLDGRYPNSEKCIIGIDFRPILGQNGETVDQESRPDSCLEAACKKIKRIGHRDNELDFLSFVAKSGKFTRRKLLTHPAVAIFLHQKWRRIRKQFWLNFVCYVFWLLLYTSYVVQIYLIKCPCRFYTEGTKNSQEETLIDNFNSTNSSILSEEDECLKASEINGRFCLLLLLTLFMGLYEVTKIVVIPRWYFKSKLNILHWTLLFLVMATFIPTFVHQSSIPAEQYQLSALAIFLAWSLILAQIAKFPSVGAYMEIFGHVLKHFWSFLLMNISLFVAFALAFSLLFPGNKPNTIFPYAFLKIFVMMVGEMEWNRMFYDDLKEQAAGPLMGHFLYVTFVIVVTIVLMNLLIGLTVSDIRGLQKEAELSRVTRQIMDIFHLESFLFSKKIPKFLKKTCRKMTTVITLNQETRIEEHQHNSRNSHDHPLLVSNKYVFKFRPNDIGDKSVPNKLKIAALELAIRVRNENKTEVCELKKCPIEIIQLKTESGVIQEKSQPLISNF